MNTLGIRCSNTDYTFCILNGTKEKPSLIYTQESKYPKGFRKPESLRWFVLEVEDFIANHSIEKVVMKASEGMARNKAFEERVEYEAMVYYACANKGLRAVFKKVKSTLAKDLGQKGRGKYLGNIDTSLIPGFADLNEKQREAILAAWSELT